MNTKTRFYAVGVAVALGVMSGSALAQDADQPAVRQAPGMSATSEARPAKSSLDQSAVRTLAVRPAPRPTLTSAPAAMVPKILGSYR